tara:strand:- start:1582 stop:3927 length:2346 start_codon:yes stop_codon:yes gene_type:complete
MRSLGSKLSTYTSKTRADVQLEALYDYAAQRPDELSLVKGDVVVGLQHVAGWWYGKRVKQNGSRGERGYFPANFTREVRLLDSVLDWAAGSSSSMPPPPPPELLEHLQLRVRDGPVRFEPKRPAAPSDDLSASTVAVTSRIDNLEHEQHELRKAVALNGEARSKAAEQRNSVLEAELVRVAKAAARTSLAKDAAEARIRELERELAEAAVTHGSRARRNELLLTENASESVVIAELREALKEERALVWHAESERDEAKRSAQLTANMMLKLDAHETLVAKGAARIIRLERERIEAHEAKDEHAAMLAAATATLGRAEAVHAEERLHIDGELQDANRRAREAERERDAAAERCVELQRQLERALSGRMEFGILSGGGDPEKPPSPKRSRFKKVGITPGKQIWRIELDDDGETTHVHTIKRARHGLFAVGDSYIVLVSVKDPETPSVLKYTIYLFIGPESELNERRTAAEKAVELEDLLPNKAKAQVLRVVGGRESKGFAKLWRPGQYKVISGGSDTAYDPDTPGLWEAQLLHVKGTAKQMLTSSIPRDAACMNHGDCFLLNAGATVYVWYGRDSSVFERHESKRLASELAVRQNAELSEAADDAFWAMLTGTAEDVVDGENDDASFEATKVKVYSLMLLSDERTGSLEVVPLMSNVRKLDRDLLDPDDCFVVDLNTLVVVWVGSGSTDQERRGAMSYVEHYLDTCPARHITKFTPVRRVLEADAWPKKMERAFGKKSAFSTAIGAVLASVKIDNTLAAGLSISGGAKKVGGGGGDLRGSRAR